MFLCFGTLPYRVVRSIILVNMVGYYTHSGWVLYPLRLGIIPTLPPPPLFFLLRSIRLLEIFTTLTVRATSLNRAGIILTQVGYYTHPPPPHPCFFC